MPNLPPATQEMIRQFEAAEAAERQQKAEVKAARRALSKKPDRPEKTIEIVPRKQMTSREVEREARKLGFRVEPGNGRHGKHIVSADGKARRPLPDHPGNLATGTCLSINEFLREHRERKK